MSNDRENAIEAAYSSWSLHRGFPRTENQAFNAGADYQAKQDAAEIERLRVALIGVLNTGLNGGNNMRLSFIAAGQKELTPELLADAERSEEAVKIARLTLKEPNNG